MDIISARGKERWKSLWTTRHASNTSSDDNKADKLNNPMGALRAAASKQATATASQLAWVRPPIVLFWQVEAFRRAANSCRRPVRQQHLPEKMGPGEAFRTHRAICGGQKAQSNRRGHTETETCSACDQHAHVLRHRKGVCPRAPAGRRKLYALTLKGPIARN